LLQKQQYINIIIFQAYHDAGRKITIGRKKGSRSCLCCDHVLPAPARSRVDILVGLIDLAAQLAAFVRGHAAMAALPFLLLLLRLEDAALLLFVRALLTLHLLARLLLAVHFLALHLALQVALRLTLLHLALRLLALRARLRRFLRLRAGRGHDAGEDQARAQREQAARSRRRAGMDNLGDVGRVLHVFLFSDAL
jgi:hypothetical protein